MMISASCLNNPSALRVYLNAIHEVIDMTEQLASLYPDAPEAVTLQRQLHELNRIENHLLNRWLVLSS